MGKQRTNERKFKMTRSLSPSKRHNKSTVTEEEDKKKRQQVPLSLSNFSLSLLFRVFLCALSIYKITSQNTKRLDSKEMYKSKKRAKRAKFLNFFRFLAAIFDVFFVSSSLFTKKRKFFFHSSKKKISISFVCFGASEYTHT